MLPNFFWPKIAKSGQILPNLLISFIFTNFIKVPSKSGKKEKAKFPYARCKVDALSQIWIAKNAKNAYGIFFTERRKYLITLSIKHAEKWYKYNWKIKVECSRVQ